MLAGGVGALTAGAGTAGTPVDNALPSSSRWHNSPAMSLTPGTRIGVYEIVEKIGAGGMGEVYRAHDARLRRDVAIKVLPADVAADPDRLRRFEQEALATAALNHPNILAVYDIGREGDRAFVVSELLEGRTMRQAMAGGPMPVRKVLEYAIPAMLGLAAAHEKGIVHRDLKPENLFVTADERVKILDFGLAKLSDARGSGASTVLAAVTEPGMVLGTIGYMAPEQVRGVAVDHRADLFSIGAVLYEMLAGRRAFVGDTAADTMTAILKEVPAPLEDTGRSIPPALARVVDRCLEKQPSRRFQSASDLAFALQTLSTGATSGSTMAMAGSVATSGAMASDSAMTRPPARVTPMRLAMLGAGMVGAVAAGMAASAWMRPAPAPAPFFTMDIAAPAGHVVGVTSALSPDGSRIAYEVLDDQRRGRLWLRTLATGEARPLEGTDDGDMPFWSPDGNSLGFFANRRLYGIDLTTGKVRVLCDADGARVAGTWNVDDVILFSREANAPLMRVDLRRAGAAVELAHARGVRPKFLPDGRHFLYTSGIQLGDSGSPSRTIRRGDLASEQTADVVGGRDAVFAAGHLIFVRSNSLLAQPFEPGTHTLSGTPRVLIDDMGRYSGDVGSNFSVAGDRLLAYRRDAEVNRQLVWYARDGRRLGAVDHQGSWRNPEFSPDDAWIAAQRNQFQGLREDVWLYDVNRRTPRALASTASSEYSPVWSADGERVTFRVIELGPTVSAPGTVKLVERTVESGAERLVTTLNSAAGETFQAFTPDGRSALMFRVVDGNRDIVLHPLDGVAAPVSFAKTPFNETQPSISPNGRWLAYVSDELGSRHVYIQPFPAGGPRIHVTEGTAGGVQPRWSRDGRELYYLASDRRLVAVPVISSSDALRLAPATPLFKTTIEYEAGVGTRADYDVTRDGQRFIVAEPRPQLEGAALTVLVNWTSGLRPTASTPER